MDDIAKQRKMLIYRANYRGFKEADILIGGFAKKNVPTMSANELNEFERLLTIDDRKLYAWMIGDAEAPAEVRGPVLTAMCAFDPKD